MADAEEFRKLALALPGVEEGHHQGHPDFRVGGKIFASLSEDGRTGFLRLTPELLTRLAADSPGTFSGAGGWAKQGWTRVDLAAVPLGTLRGLLEVALELRAPAPRAARPPRKRGGASAGAGAGDAGGGPPPRRRSPRGGRQR